jgi:hypothetical protein
MFLWLLASDALLSVLSNFYRMCRDVYDNRHTKLYMPTSTGLSLITTDLKVKKKKKTFSTSHFTCILQKYYHKNFYIFPRSITIHHKTQVTILMK